MLRKPPRNNRRTSESSRSSSGAASERTVPRCSDAADCPPLSWPPIPETRARTAESESTESPGLRRKSLCTAMLHGPPMISGSDIEYRMAR